VAIHTLKRVTAFDGESVTLADVYSGTETRLPCRSLVIVGMRKPRDELLHALRARGTDLEKAGIASVTPIGDCLAPGAIVHAVHSGHRYAREFEVPAGDVSTGARARADLPYARDFPV
jgi:dimethylamine/trimethylamine dehydrogenase